ncbi:MAG: tRNA lysidine(34) synthetase TilS [Steroidobacteraceae bacterium]
MTGGFEARVAASLRALLPEYPRVALCVAVSGGLDSTALLTALASLRGVRRQLRAVHVDHGISPHARAWAAHCRALAERLGVPLTVLAVGVRRVRGGSLEAAAREARYAGLERELAPAEVLLTAQHADDQLETVLLQMLRGAGLPGIAAMPPVAQFGRGRLARPLLRFERADIEAFARRRALEWVEDESNGDERLDRNYLRRQVIPALRARWPAASRAVGRTARHAAEGQRLLDLLGSADAARAAIGAALSIRALHALGPERRRNALRYWIARSGHPLPDTRRLEELAGPLLEARPDAHPQVAWAGTVAERDGNLLTLGASADPVALEPHEWPLRGVPVLELAPGLGRLELAQDRHGPIDLEALPDTVSVRSRRGGERLRPRRGGPSRTLKALLQEARVARVERARIPLVCAGEQVLAAGDLWVDARIQAGAAARRRGRIIWHRADPAV